MSRKFFPQIQAMAAGKRALFLILGLFFLCLPERALANNLSISNVTLTSPNATDGTIQVQFDISWSNSWRNQTNYDAAWVFIKYSTDSGTTWNHAKLETAGTNPSGVSIGSGTAIDIIVPTDLMGAFIQRSATGSGALSTTSVQLVWDYEANGLTASSTARVKVFGVEMVYIPTGAFYAGDTAATGTFKQGSSDTDPWYISSAGAISVTNTASNGYYYTSAAFTNEDATGATFTIPATFPNGYSAFYLMKYEVTEGEFVEFFNTLTSAQKTTRDMTGLSQGKNSDSVVDRNTIAWTSGDATTTVSDRGVGYWTFQGTMAFYDWAALRPYTELEFEKACRGTLAAVASESAWGNTTITQAVTISGTENGTETITTAGANSNYSVQTFSGGDASTGPLRVGIYATSSSTRTQSGAGYYGNMELSGNLSEHPVTVGNSTGRGFTGTHGNGVLTTIASYEGNATNTDWPGLDGTPSRGVTGGLGMGYRGSNWGATGNGFMVSNRQVAAEYNSNVHSHSGVRGARTASS